MAKATHVIARKGVYFMVEGKMQEMTVDAEIPLESNEKTEALVKRGFIKPIGDRKSVKLDNTKAEDGAPPPPK